MIAESAKKNGIFTWQYRCTHDRWTEDAVTIASQTIKDEDLWPVCVPSYKRGKAAATLKELDKYKSPLKVFVFGYKDDPQYQEYMDFVNRHDTWKFVECDFADCLGNPVKGIRYKRRFMVEYMASIGMPKYFALDDDIYSWAFCWTKRWEHKEDKPRRRSAKTYCDYLDGLKTWQLTIMCDSDYEKIGTCGQAWDITCSFRHLSGDTMDEAELCERHCSQGCEYINARVLLDAGVNYIVDPDTWEDYTFFCKEIENHVIAKGIRWLTFYTKAMKPSDTIASAGTNTWTIRSMNTYKVFGELFRLKSQDGQINIKPRGALYDDWPRDENNKFKIIHNPILLNLIDTKNIDGFKKKVIELENNKQIGDFLQVKNEMKSKSLGFKF